MSLAVHLLIMNYFSLSLNLQEIQGIHLLIEIYQTLMMTTNDCERTVNHSNIITLTQGLG